MAKARRTMNRGFGWAELLNATDVLCSWNGKDGREKWYPAEVVEVAPGRVTLRTERGKVFVRPLPTAVVREVVARR